MWGASPKGFSRLVLFTPSPQDLTRVRDGAPLHTPGSLPRSLPFCRLSLAHSFPSAPRPPSISLTHLCSALPVPAQARPPLGSAGPLGHMTVCLTASLSWRVGSGSEGPPP